MNSQPSKNRKTRFMHNISLSFIMSALVSAIVLLALFVALLVFVRIYQNSMEQNAVTSSEQAVIQVKNTITNYTDDMSEIMEMIQEKNGWGEPVLNAFFMNLMEIRSDVVAVTAYDDSGNLLRCWSRDYVLKDMVMENLSYMPIKTEEEGRLYISAPHVESLFVNEYPWVVTISQRLRYGDGDEQQIAMDIRFSNIANYVDDVGIGQHGYCFIMDTDGNIVYHPQQQLLYSGLKEENTEELKEYADGIHAGSSAIYTIRQLHFSNVWIV